MRESEWQDQIVAFARERGWFVAHFHASQSARGRHVTAAKYDGRGYPDLTLVRERVVWVECKSDRGEVSERQQSWLDRIGGAGGEVYVWWPKDESEMRSVLH